MSQRSPASRADAVRARRVLDVLDEGIIVRGTGRAIVEWNAATLRMLQLTPAQLRGDEPPPPGWKLAVESGEPLPARGDSIRAALDRAMFERSRVRVTSAGGDPVWLSVNAHVQDDADEVTFTLTDVTAQRAAERENERYRQIIDALDASHRILEESPVAICSVDTDGSILRSNIAFLALAGFETSSIFALISEDDRAALREAFVWLIDGRMPSMRRETRLARPVGPPLWCEITAVAMRQGMEDAAILLLVNDVTERHEREVRLRQLAERDPLTGVHNRRSFVHALAQRLRSLRPRGRRAPTDHALLVIDLDGFKDVNDTCGHAGGDAVLIAVAAGIRERTRATDTVGRLGGDEFAALLELRDAASAVAVAEAIIERVVEAAATVEGAPRVTASIGIVHLDPRCSAEQTLARADHAMYEAKHSGKARAVDAGVCSSEDLNPNPSAGRGSSGAVAS